MLRLEDIEEKRKVPGPATWAAVCGSFLIPFKPSTCKQYISRLETGCRHADLVTLDSFCRFFSRHSTPGSLILRVVLSFVQGCINREGKRKEAAQAFFSPTPEIPTLKLHQAGRSKIFHLRSRRPSPGKDDHEKGERRGGFIRGEMKTLGNRRTDER